MFSDEKLMYTESKLAIS